MISGRLLLSIVLAALVALGIFGYGDFRETGRQLANFPLTHFLAALALASLNYLLRFLRWAYYLKVLALPVPLGSSSLVFLSGLAMSVTPGKAGEVLKCYLLRDRWGFEVARTLPVVLMERLTDLAAVVALALIGIALLPGPLVAVLAGVLAVCFLILLAILFTGGGRLFDLPVLRRWKSGLTASQDALHQLARPGVMAVALALAAAAWLSEGLALWVILIGLDASLDLYRVLPIYAAATLVGALTTLPGGLVGTEGSMLALLQQSGIARGPASASTLLVRLATLWFAVAVGLAAWAWLNRHGNSRRIVGDRGGPEGPAGASGTSIGDQFPGR